MAKTNTIRLLILNDSRSEAERLISMLHNSGHPARAQHVDTPEALVKLIEEKTWDLMIGIDTTKNVPPSEAIKQIRRLNKDIPLILLSDREDIGATTEGMKLGATDVVTLDEDQHLLLVIQREIRNREDRDRRRVAERRYNEISRRNQQLLDSSRDAIAFVQDGMFLYTNDSFAELLDHASRDDLECMPVIDIVQSDQHAQVKNFLKEFTIKGSDVDASELKFTALLENSSKKSLTVEVRKATYDEEPCIQFLVRAKTDSSEVLEAQLEQIKNQDIATGLYNKHYMLETVSRAVEQAQNKKFNSVLYHIGIDNFMETVQGKLGVASADVALATIANHTKSLVSDKGVLCRFSEDSFMLVEPRISASKALEKAQTLCQQLRDFIVDLDGNTLQFNYHVGVAAVTEATANAEIPIDHAIKALEMTRKKGQSDGAVLASLFKPEVKKDTKKDIEQMVQTALDSGKFKLLFQPILSLRGSQKEHYEVLLRMVDEDGQEISPTEFLATAAKIGATTKLDRWVILESIKVLSEHRAKGNNTYMILNLSRESMLDATLPPWLGVAFKAAKLPTNAIIFQLQEIDINDHLNVAGGFTKALKALGCELGVSHFGCALNPFNALKNIEASYIKVDGSFTQELQSAGDGSNAAALNELVSELHQQDKITIVPFVENASVLSKLWQSGVHYIQGYYLQEPVDKMNYDFDMES